MQPFCLQHALDRKGDIWQNFQVFVDKLLVQLLARTWKPVAFSEILRQVKKPF